MDGTQVKSDKQSGDGAVRTELWIERTCELLDRLMKENEELRGKLKMLLPVAQECQSLRATLKKHEDRAVFHLTTEDEDTAEKTRRIVDGVANFGEADFAELSCWIFASSLINHRVVHQRIDEASLLWRAVKMSAGPILELGRAAGGSTLVLLGASASRPVVSIDRAPSHHGTSEHVFKRPDVARRLTLYRQTSREPIAEMEFGMMFVDADHSYEGVCHDIATFWNQLRALDGRPAIAAFHDAAANPIMHVSSVKRACDELLAEPQVARVVETWGSMLVVEKLADIDQDRWYAKDDREFWRHYAAPAHPVLAPVVIRGRAHAERQPIRTGAANLLGEENVDGPSWVKRGVTIEMPPVTADNPLRLLREAPELGEHGIEKSMSLPARRVNFTVFVRPHRLETLRLSILGDERVPFAQADFHLSAHSRVGRLVENDGVDVLDASFIYRNGYFACSLAVSLPSSAATATVAVNGLDAEGAVSYAGHTDRGFFINLASVREFVE